MRRAFSLWATLILFATVAIGAAGNSWARAIRVDQGNNFDSLGTALIVTPIDVNTTPVTVDLATPVDLTVLSQPPVLPSTTTGFQLNYGAGLVSEVNIYANGYLSLGSALDPGFDGNAILNNVVAPFYLATGVAPTLMSYSQGLVDLTSPFDITDAIQTFRVTWQIDGINPGDTFNFQVVLYDMSGLAGGAVGDFDMEINYGSDPDFDPAPPVGSTVAAGFHLGTNVFDFPLTAGTFSAANDYTFAFRNGVLTSPTSVTEPGTLALVGAGLIVIAWGMVRRRRRRQH
jgi:hypothetical protein